MGVYVYHARKSKSIMVKDTNGESKRVHMLQYTCRLSQYDSHSNFGTQTKREALFKAQIARMEDSYCKGDIQLVALESDDKFEDGLTVYDWSEQNTNRWYDCDSMPPAVGVLEKVGKRFRLGKTHEQKVKEIGEEYFFQ